MSFYFELISSGSLQRLLKSLPKTFITIPSTLILVSKYFPAVGLESLSFSAMITLCLYHYWLQQEQMYSRRLETLA